MLQRTEIIGHLGADAEVRTTNGGKTVIAFSVAVSERWTDHQGQRQERTTWYKCSWWTTATTIAQYLSKGTLVYVTGTPNADAYLNSAGEVVVNQGINVRGLDFLAKGNA